MLVPFPSIYNSPPTHLCQGDIFRRFGKDIFPEKGHRESGWLILTYTCDLKNPKDLTNVNYCPVYKLRSLLESLLEKNKNKSRDKIKNNVRSYLSELSRNGIRSYYFLSPCPELEDSPSYADLTKIYTLNVSYINEIINNRILSLNSPWREKLGWMIGYLYSRVAIKDLEIEDDIKSFIFQENKDLITKYIQETVDWKLEAQKINQTLKSLINKKIQPLPTDIKKAVLINLKSVITELEEQIK